MLINDNTLWYTLKKFIYMKHEFFFFGSNEHILLYKNPKLHQLQTTPSILLLISNDKKQKWQKKHNKLNLA